MINDGDLQRVGNTEDDDDEIKLRYKAHGYEIRFHVKKATERECVYFCVGGGCEFVIRDP